jgi:hypothetical protein
MNKCKVCHEPIVPAEGKGWTHAHGDVYCGTGDGAMAELKGTTTRISFQRLGRSALGAPADIVLEGVATPEELVLAINGAARKRLRSSYWDISLVQAGDSATPHAFYVEGGRFGEGTITVET